jgi:hypothetical protein
MLAPSRRAATKELIRMPRSLSRPGSRPRRSPARPHVEPLEERNLLSAAFWGGYANDPQHTAISWIPGQPLDAIRWQTPVDLKPQYSGNELLIHYGSPLVTLANTVTVPVKTGAFGDFEVQARDGSDGSLKWTVGTDYILPPHSWTPSFSPTLTPGGRLFFAGAGGTIYEVDTPDANHTPVVEHLAFYGLSNYLNHQGVLNHTVFINTPITSDAAGDIFFGFQVTGSNPLHLTGGIARIDADGAGTWVAASTAADDSTITKVVHNCAPALSNDGKTLYVAVNNGDGFGFATGYLVALDSRTLAPRAHVQLLDPQTGLLAILPDQGTASPTVGPDGDVYFGVLEDPFPDHHDRGWLMHFSADLSQEKTPGAFGWDDTASVVPSWVVPSYHGTSSYLLMTKYNNYAGIGGDGQNRVAVLDPNAVMPDPISGIPVMQTVLKILGPTPDPDFIDFFPHAVREWCINTAAVDVLGRSIFVNSEDGRLYRWDLTTNKLTQAITLTSGLGQAYTPTVIGADGTVYAISNGILFAVGLTPAASPDAAASAPTAQPQGQPDATMDGLASFTDNGAWSRSGSGRWKDGGPGQGTVAGSVVLQGTVPTPISPVGLPPALDPDVSREPAGVAREGPTLAALESLFASDPLFGLAP